MLPELFYTISFSISIVASSFCIFVGFIIVLIVSTNQQYRTILNMMTCNTAIASMIYSFFQIFFAGYGLRGDWDTSQNVCPFRAYLYTVVCIAVPVSYGVQAISRLFYGVLYKHRFLLTWQTHWYLICGNYLISVIGPVPIFFIKDGYTLEIESRLCLTTTKVFGASILSVSVAYLIPLTVIIIVYGIIFLRARQSTRRVGAVRIQVSQIYSNRIITNLYPTNMTREVTLMRNILILINILVVAGTPYLVLVIWQVIVRTPSPPEPSYMLALLFITVSFMIKMSVLFYMTKDVKNTAIAFLRKFI